MIHIVWKGVGTAANCSGVIKRLQSIDKTVNCGTGGSVYGSTVIAAVVTFSVCIVILSHFYYLESNSSCEDQTNTNLRVLAIKRESRTICSWNITAPEFNRVWVRISVLDSKEENSTVCPNYLKVSFQILCIMFSISAPFTLQASLIKISIC